MHLGVYEFYNIQRPEDIAHGCREGTTKWLRVYKIHSGAYIAVLDSMYNIQGSRKMKFIGGHNPVS